MKGPGLRLDLEVRRQWRCPNCNRLRKTDGWVTHLECLCTESPVAMKMVEARRLVRSFADEVAKFHRPPGGDEMIETNEHIEQRPSPVIDDVPAGLDLNDNEFGDGLSESGDTESGEKDLT